MKEEDAQIARRQWLKNTQILSCTFAKVNTPLLSKFSDV